MRKLLALCLLVLALLSPLRAQGAVQGPPLPDGFSALTSQDDGSLPSIDFKIGGGQRSPRSLSGAVQIVLLMTLLSLGPAILMTLTSFTRVVVVLSFMRRAMSVGDLPPNLIVTGLAFFLSLFIMRPVLRDLNEQAFKPYQEEKVSLGEATDKAATIMTRFLLKQTREKDLALIVELSGEPMPKSREEVPFLLVVPAFALSEIKTSFEMGFVVFLPFLVIDLVISCILISMGMFTLPPVMISTPFKLLLFVMVDGWNLVIKSLAQSFVA